MLQFCYGFVLFWLFFTIYFLLQKELWGSNSFILRIQRSWLFARGKQPVTCVNQSNIEVGIFLGWFLEICFSDCPATYFDMNRLAAIAYPDCSIRAYPDKRVVMRPSEKSSGQGGRPKRLARRGLLHVENVFSPTTQASGFAAGHNRADYLDRL